MHNYFFVTLSFLTAIAILHIAHLQ